MFTPNGLSMLLQHCGNPDIYRLRIRVCSLTVPNPVEFIGFTGHDKGILVRDAKTSEVMWLSTSEVTLVSVILAVPHSPDHA